MLTDINFMEKNNNILEIWTYNYKLSRKLYYELKHYIYKVLFWKNHVIGGEINSIIR